MKDYEGFLFESTNLLDVHRSLSDLSVKLHNKAIGKYKPYIANEIAHLYDMWTMDLMSGVVKPYSDVVYNAAAKMNDCPDQNVDYHFSVTLMPIEDDATYLATIDTLHDDFKDDFMDDTEAVEYNYINECKPPIGVDEEAWDSRRLRWELATKNGSFCRVGYTRYLTNLRDFEPAFEPASLLEYLPSLEERARRISMDLLLKQKRITNINDLNRLLSDPKTDLLLKQQATNLNTTLIPQLTLEQFKL